MDSLHELLKEIQKKDPLIYEKEFEVNNEFEIEGHIHDLEMTVVQIYEAIELWKWYKYRFERAKTGYEPYYIPNSLFEKCCQDEKKIMEEEKDGN